jgi:hypothetical protein
LAIEIDLGDERYRVKLADWGETAVAILVGLLTLGMVIATVGNTLDSEKLGPLVILVPLDVGMVVATWKMWQIRESRELIIGELGFKITHRIEEPEVYHYTDFEYFTAARTTFLTYFVIPSGTVLDLTLRLDDAESVTLTIPINHANTPGLDYLVKRLAECSHERQA